MARGLSDGRPAPSENACLEAIDYWDQKYQSPTGMKNAPALLNKIAGVKQVFQKLKRGNYVKTGLWEAFCHLLRIATYGGNL